MTTTLTVTTSTTSYPVIVGAGVLDTLADRLATLDLRGTLWLIADEHLIAVAEHIAGMLSTAGFRVRITTIPSGEQSKSFNELHRLYDWMIENGIERRDAVLALGGGVVGDLAGLRLPPSYVASHSYNCRVLSWQWLMLRLVVRPVSTIHWAKI